MERIQPARVSVRDILWPFGMVVVGAAVVVAVVLVAAAVANSRAQARSAASARELRAMLNGLSSRSYRSWGAYVGPQTALVEPTVVRRRGIPWVVYPRIGAQPNPAVAAQFGLLAYGRWLRSHHTADRREVVRIANWLLGRQQTDGRWLYGFDWVFTGGRVVAPWGSALAQGQAISLLARAYRLTGDPAYRIAALRAFAPLRKSVAAGGFKVCFQTCDYPFLEEYVSQPPADVLNGFMFTLIGVKDLASIAHRSGAAKLFAGGLRALHRMLPLYDSAGVARYSLTSGDLASQKYQAICVYLLQALYSIRRDPRFLFYARRWLAHLAQAPA